MEGEGENTSYSHFTNETPWKLALRRTFICLPGLNEPQSPSLKLVWKLSGFLDTNDSLETSSQGHIAFFLRKDTSFPEASGV